MHAYKRVTRVYSQTFRRCSCRKKRLHVKISECTGSKSSYLTCSPKSMAILVMASGSRKRIRGQYALRDRQSIMTNYDNNVEGIRPWRVALWLSASSCLKWNWKNWRHCHSQRFRWEGQANISHYIIMSFTRELNLTATKCWCRKPLKMSILVSERLKWWSAVGWLCSRACVIYTRAERTWGVTTPFSLLQLSASVCWSGTKNEKHWFVVSYGTPVRLCLRKKC